MLLPSIWLNLAFTMIDRPHILCVGLAAMDCIATADHFPTLDEKMRSTSLRYFGGGNAANTASGIGRQKDILQSSLLTGVGDDANGQAILRSLREDHNVNTDLCEIYKGPSPFSYILVVDDTRTCIHQPATGDLSIQHVNLVLSDDALKSFCAVHFDARYPRAAVALAERCVRLNVPYSVDVERLREGLEDLLENASVVVVNSLYCDTVLQGDIPIAAKLKAVFQSQAPNAVYVVATMGSKGSCLVRLQESHDVDESSSSDGLILEGAGDIPSVERRETALFCGSFPVETVVDTTGAGDAFQAGLYSALWSMKSWKTLDDKSLGRILRIATRFASQKIQKPGAREGIPSLSTDEFLQREFSLLRTECPTSADNSPI